MVVISDLGDALITYDLEMRYTSLNMCIDLMIVSMTLKLMGILVPSRI